MAQSRKDLDCLGVEALGELDDLIVSRGQFAAAPRVRAAAVLYDLQKDVAIRRRDMAHQIAKRETAFAKGPVHAIGGDRADYVHRPLMDFLEVVEKLNWLLDFHTLRFSSIRDSA